MIKILAFFFTCSSLLAQDVLNVDKIVRNEADWASIVERDILKLKSRDKEFTLPAGQRVDIYDGLNHVAYEVDWVYKYPEGIGQSLTYAAKTKSRPGIVLLIKTGEDEHYTNAMIALTDLIAHGYDYDIIIVNVDNLKYWRFK